MGLLDALELMLRRVKLPLKKPAWQESLPFKLRFLNFYCSL